MLTSLFVLLFKEWFGGCDALAALDASLHCRLAEVFKTILLGLMIDLGHTPSNLLIKFKIIFKYSCQYLFECE